MSTTGDNEDRPKEAQSGPTQQPEASVNRRDLLRASLAIASVLVAAGVAAVTRSIAPPANPPQVEEVSPTPPQTITQTVTVSTQAGVNQTATAQTSSTTSSTSQTSSPFPRFMVANISAVTETQAIFFNYPLEETASILVKLGVKAPGGVGPDGDIVAYSEVCQHLGCIYTFVPSGASPPCDNTFKAPSPMGYCCCHGSMFDLTDAGKVLGGPSPRPVPQVTLEFDSSTGNIYAVGMGPPTIYGHNTGSNDVLNDLQGGTLVTGD
jgi:arsenite oxidase small subunit